MEGNEFVRECSDCKSKVYDLTGLNDKEMREFIELNEGEVCGMVHVDRQGYVVNGKCEKEERRTIGRIIYNEKTNEERIEEEIVTSQKRLERLTEMKRMITKKCT